MVRVRVLAAVVSGVLVASCGGGEDGSAAPASTSTAAAAASSDSSTTVPASTPSTSTSSTATTAPPSTTPPYGSPCRAGSHPDCIDPDGDGAFELLEGGADCLKSLGAGSGLCADLDGDGRAGYPDSE